MSHRERERIDALLDEILRLQAMARQREVRIATFTRIADWQKDRLDVAVRYFREVLDFDPDALFAEVDAKHLWEVRDQETGTAA